MVTGPCSTILRDPQPLPPVPLTPFFLNVQECNVQVNGEAKKFNEWLSEKLSDEQKACVSELKEMITEKLREHREFCFTELKAYISAHPAGAAFSHIFNDPVGGSRIDAESPSCPLSAAISSQRIPKKRNTLKDLRSASSGESTPASEAAVLVVPQPATEGTTERTTKNRVQEALQNLGAAKTEFSVNHDMHSLMVSLQLFVASTRFEITSMVVILLNTLFLALEMQYTGFDRGQYIKFEGRTKNAEETWPYADSVFLIASVIFNTFFIWELMMRLIAMRWRACRNKWVWLDSVLVPLGVLDVLYSLEVIDGLGFNPTTLRVCRLLRLLRIARTMQSNEAFHSLFLLIKSVRASLTALFWSILLLLLIMLAFGMMINNLLSDYFEDDSEPLQTRQDLYTYFGTFSRTMLTMFEVTFGNWVVPTRKLFDSSGEVYAFIFVLYRCVFCFAVINVIRAVFITETTRVAAMDDEVALMMRESSAKGLKKKVDTLFQALDHSGDGNIDWEDFMQGLRDPVLMKYMAMIEIDTSDLENLFRLLDNGDGQVDWKEFSQNVKQLRGNARSLDMITTLHVARNIESFLKELFKPEQHKGSKGSIGN